MSQTVRLVKRTLDIVVATFGLALCAPLLIVIGVLIRLDSPGPILFRQHFAGRLLPPDGTGRPRFEQFYALKFRTMTVDAEKRTGPVLAQENDPRVTRLGRVLRRTGIHGLPQLWNVLRGDMSIVGPRAERPELMQAMALAIPYYEERMRHLRPGLTGLAQVSLTYTGQAPPDSVLASHVDALTNPFKLPEAEGALADDFRVKLLYDLAYAAATTVFAHYIRWEIAILWRAAIKLGR